MYERKNDLFAVVDTNVIVSGLISSNKASARSILDICKVIGCTPEDLLPLKKIKEFEYYFYQ